MKSIVITNQSEPIQLVEKDIPQLKEGEVLVKIKAAALNRRDQWMREGLYPGMVMGTTLGSDGCGVVYEGPSDWKGKEVILNPNINWGDDLAVQSPDYTILGMPVDGTLAEYVKVAADRLHVMPSHLTFVEAAALPLAGLTAYRAVVTKGQVNNCKRVLITGIGGGVSQFALQFSVALGAEVFVTSRDNAKIEKAIEAGAKGGFNSGDSSWYKETHKVGAFDTIIDSVGGNSLNAFLKIVKPAGRIVVYGSTTGYPEKLDVFRLFWSQAQILGSTMGSDQEFEKMITLVNSHQLKPTIDKVYAFGDYLASFDRFKSPDHFGKIILEN
jgi:NADPH:quinone reductase-like Zn-dependent oxidoreductase